MGRTMGEKEFREHVSWVMFLLSILVIWAHSYNADLFYGGVPAAEGIWGYVHQFETFMSTVVALTAVPGFFMLSAYLFFRNFTWKKLPGKWKSRVRSVAIPYVAWNLLYYLGYAAAARLPGVSGIIGKEPAPFCVGAALDAVLHYRYAPVFWYLYQLMFLILLSPVLYWIVKNRFRGIVFLAALMAAVHFHLDMMHPNTDAMFYYSFGIFMAVHGRKYAERSWGRGRILAGAASFLLAVICCRNMGRPGAAVLWTVMFRFFIPVSVWLFFDSGRAGKTRPWMRQSLFLYGIHFIVVRAANKGSALVFGKFFAGPPMAFLAVAVYLALPALVVAVSYLTARILNWFLPPVWRIFSGGRELEM